MELQRITSDIYFYSMQCVEYMEIHPSCHIHQLYAAELFFIAIWYSMGNVTSCGYTTNYLSINLLINIWVVCSLGVLWMNLPCKSFYLQILVWIYIFIFLRYLPRHVIARSCVRYRFHCSKDTLTLTTKNSLFNHTHSVVCLVVYHCGFKLHFPDD